MKCCSHPVCGQELDRDLTLSKVFMVVISSGSNACVVLTPLFFLVAPTFSIFYQSTGSGRFHRLCYAYAFLQWAA